MTKSKQRRVVRNIKIKQYLYYFNSMQIAQLELLTTLLLKSFQKKDMALK